METHKEKRHYKRYDCSSPMHLYRMDFQDQACPAEARDYSRGGLSLLTTEKLVMGQLVYLEMKKHDKLAQGPEKYKSYYGSVKWASPYSSTAEGIKEAYRYGIEYSEPVVYN